MPLLSGYQNYFLCVELTDESREGSGVQETQILSCADPYLSVATSCHCVTARRAG